MNNLLRVVFKCKKFRSLLTDLTSHFIRKVGTFVNLNSNFLLGVGLCLSLSVGFASCYLGRHDSNTGGHWLSPSKTVLFT